MPIKLILDRVPVEFIFHGEIDAMDIFQATKEVTAFEQTQPVVPHRFADLRGTVNLKINFSDVMNLATERQAAKFPNHIKSAILIGNKVQLGYARMFQNLNDNPQMTIRIFEDETEARAWLAD